MNTQFGIIIIITIVEALYIAFIEFRIHVLNETQNRWYDNLRKHTKEVEASLHLSDILLYRTASEVFQEQTEEIMDEVMHIGIESWNQQELEKSKATNN